MSNLIIGFLVSLIASILFSVTLFPLAYSIEKSHPEITIIAVLAYSIAFTLSIVLFFGFQSIGKKWKEKRYEG